MSAPTRRFARALLVFGALALAAPTFAKEPPGNSSSIDDGSNDTPFSRMSDKAVEKRYDHDGVTRGNKPCRDFKGNKPKGKGNADAFDCGAPGFDVTKHEPEETFDDGGKRKSKKFKNTIVIDYDHPKQRGDANSSWPPARFNPTRTPMGPEVERNQAPDHSFKEPNSIKVGENPFTPPGKTGPAPGLACATLHAEGGVTTESDGTCDMSKLFVKLVNKKAKDAPAPQGQQKKKDKAFHADDDGNCLSGELPANTALKCGEERRRQKFTETYEIYCDKDGFEYKDGHCKKENPNAAFAKALGVEPTGITLTDGGYAMMGFTFAPPRLKWGIDYSEEACIDLVFDEFCFTVLSVFAGYDIDIAAGLRLPVDFDLANVPSPKAVAGRTVSLVPQLTPADFSAADYKAFCQQHNMADGWIIASCDRFSFPEYFSQLLHDAQASVGVSEANRVEIDGKEMVAQAIIKVGIFVEILGVSVVNVGVDAGNDFSTMCTTKRLMDNPFVLIGSGFANFAFDQASNWSGSLDLLQHLKDEGINCSSFKTPFGAEQDPLNPLVFTKPTFPFLPEAGLHLPADCTGLDVKEISFKYKGQNKKVKICTGLALRYGPASLGLGLNVKFAAVSGKIDGNWGVTGDGKRCDGANCNTSGMTKTQWIAPDNSEEIQNPTLDVLFDNYASGNSQGTLQIDDLRFCLNQLQISLTADLEFGGVLSVLPSLASFPVYSVTLGAADGPCIIPIPQHNATGPLNFAIPVENYALRLANAPVSTNPAELRDGGSRLIIKPGEFGKFRVTANNLGTADTDVDNFRRTLPDAQTLSPPLPVGWVTTPDATQLAAAVLGDVSGSKTIDIDVKPFRHPRTRVGEYSIPVLADSQEAKQLSMAETDPLANKRKNAQTNLLVYVKGFREPKLAITPASTSGKPGAPVSTYNIAVQNYGNENEVAALSHELADSNTAGCGLTTLGGAGCPYRGVPTAAAAVWTTVDEMNTRLPAVAPNSIEPEAFDFTSFNLAVPADWAGMRDTTYVISVTATSTTDPETPAAKSTGSIAHTVIATKQSMTRYIGLEIAELIAQIEAANAAGQATAGALPITVRAVQAANDRALASILAGDLRGASSTLASEIRMLEGFIRAIGNLPPALVADWTARANAIIQDLRAAEASNIAS